MAIDPGKIKEAIENALLKLLPFIGDALADMTPEQKREFLLALVEAMSRGAAEGAVRGNKDKIE